MINELRINPDIAEICGIITGDGHLSRYLSPKRNNYRIEIFGDKNEEVEYFKYISSLFYKCFNKSLKLKIKDHYASLYLNSKELLEFFENVGIIVGKKSRKAYIPKKIMNNKRLSLRFLKGLADTDFNISFKKGGRKNNSYPRIVAEFASKNLISDILIILNKLNITYYRQKVIKDNNFGKFEHYRIEINGRKNLKKWLDSVGFSNLKHTSKITLWEKLGYCPPKTTISERLKIIK